MTSLPGHLFEAINGTLSVLFFWVIVWFLYDIFYVWRDKRNLCQAYSEAAASIACLVAFSGDLVIRSAVWWYRHLDNDGKMTETLLAMTKTIVGVGVTIAILGCACIIRHLAPPYLGRLPWIIAIVTSLIFGFGFAL